MHGLGRVWCSKSCCQSSKGTVSVLVHSFQYILLVEDICKIKAIKDVEALDTDKFHTFSQLTQAWFGTVLFRLGSHH